MDACMDEWMDGWTDRWMDGWVDGWMDRWIYGWKDEWVEGWMGGWVDGWGTIGTLKHVSMDREAECFSFYELERHESCLYKTVRPKCRNNCLSAVESVRHRGVSSKGVGARPIKGKILKN